MANNLRERRLARPEALESDAFAASIRPMLQFFGFCFKAAGFYVLIIVGCVVYYALKCDMGE